MWPGFPRFTSVWPYVIPVQPHGLCELLLQHARHTSALQSISGGCAFCLDCSTKMVITKWVNPSSPSWFSSNIAFRIKPTLTSYLTLQASPPPNLALPIPTTLFYPPFLPSLNLLAKHVKFTSSI